MYLFKTLFFVWFYQYLLLKGPTTSPPEKRSDQPLFFGNGSPPMRLPGTFQGIAIQQTLPNDPPDTSPFCSSLFDPNKIPRFIQLTQLHLLHS